MKRVTPARQIGSGDPPHGEFEAAHTRNGEFEAGHTRLLLLFAEEEAEKREDEEHSEVCNYYACTCGKIVGIVGYRYTDNVADAGNNRRADRYTAEAPDYSH